MPQEPSQTLIAVDTGDLPIEAFPRFQELVGAGRQGHFVVVAPASEQTEPGFNWGGQDGESREAHLTRVTELQLAETALAGWPVHIAFGDAATVVCEAAKRLLADLVIIPILDVGGHKSRAMNQQVADEVKQTAPCRVEIVPVVAGPAGPGGNPPIPPT